MISYIKQHSIKYLLFTLILFTAILSSLYVSIDIAPFILYWLTIIIFDVIYGYNQYNKLIKTCKAFTNEKIVIDDTSLESELIATTVKRLTDESMLKLKHTEQVYEEFNDYLDLWTHEMKLSIANIKQLAPYEVTLFHEIEKMEISLERMLALNGTNHIEVDQRFTSITVEELCNTAIKQEMNALLANNISIKKNIAQQVIVTDKYWIIFCIRQLLNNSIKYGAKNISITFTKNKLVISDDGLGIDPSEERLIFEKFYCGSKTKSSIKSTGIGLYLVKQILIKYAYQVTAIAQKQGLSIEIIFKD
ncbi:sensor histidine kinase [Mollicutes bacterium LVI A0078]|nr:sensor histidine kinase [Mollicutes bacterium LVI A0075]WOO91031.1 sensor histidine kinase [Mollicutes bacterium LVI A0078]